MLLASRVLCQQLSIIIVLSSCLWNGAAITSPCRSAALGEFCHADEECSGELTKCVNNACSCPNDFEIFTPDESIKICRPAPNVVNAPCQSKCRPPLVCSNGRCICWNAKTVGNACVVDCPRGKVLVGQECKKATPVGGACNDHWECSGAFSECKSQRCSCVAGTVIKGSQCVATCPDGSVPLTTCRRLLQTTLDASDNVQKMDTCPLGQMCMTYGKPSVGHCCPVFCPYGSADMSKSCNRGASLNHRCPELTTHFCHPIDSSVYSAKLCCPRPCREPTSFFLNGRCLPVAHRGDPCLVSQQCEGGRHMHCEQGRCQCGAGFEMVNATFPTCRRRCPLNALEIAGECYKRVKLEEPCFLDAQCPRNSHCREGICECDCQYKSRMKACVNPDDPLNIDGFLKGFQNIFVG